MVKYKISVNENACIGCGSCKAICPGSFGFDIKKNKAFVKKKSVSKITCEKEAADTCPANAIDIKEEK